MDINNFLKLPIIKILAMLLFLYYVYDKTKDNPRSVSYHINKENIKKSTEIVKNGINNFSSLSLESQESESQDKTTPESKTSSESAKNFIETRVGEGSTEVVCGSKIYIEYSLFSKKTSSIYNKSTIEIKVGEGFNKIIEKTAIGMKAGGIRSVDIPLDFKSGDSTYDNLISKGEMSYKILMLSIDNSKKEGSNCE